MGPTDFESQVLSGLSELRTHMRTLVGVDGTGGKIKELDSRLDAVEDKQGHEEGKQRGRIDWLTGVLASGVTLAVSKGIGYLSGHH